MSKGKGIVRYPASVLATGIVGTARVKCLAVREDAGAFRKGDLVTVGERGDAPKGKRKYGNQRTMARGIWFDSAKEAARYEVLVSRCVAGEIWNLEIQVPFEIVPETVIAGSKVRARRYVADFVYETASGRVVEDVKGFRTEMYRIKRQLMKVVHGIDINEV